MANLLESLRNFLPIPSNNRVESKRVYHTTDRANALNREKKSVFSILNGRFLKLLKH